MATETETFSFDRGINRKRGRLFLADGELYTASGYGFENDGVMNARIAKTIGEAIDTTATSKINGIHRYGSNIYASSKKLCAGSQAYFNYIYRRSTSGSHAQADILSNNTRPRFADYEKFSFVVDGYSKKAYVDGNAYEWGIANPDHAPTLAAGASGTPSGEYTCYVTYYVKFPNDVWIETGPSDSATVTVSSQKIEWSGIPICPYTGTSLTIWRRLYRTISGTAYLLTSLGNNTTQTYSDNTSDATIQSQSALSTDGYTTPPAEPVDVATYLQRMFLIKANKLYWSEAYQPFSFDSDSNVAVTKNVNENLVALINWGDQIYMPSAEEWYRLVGDNPDTWKTKRTFTDNGIINRNTMKASRYGILGLWYDGIYIFDGTTTKNITEKQLGTSFFRDLTTTNCWAEFDGRRYYFYYASTGSTLDSCLVLDFTYGLQDMRIFHDDFEADAQEYHRDSGVRYQAKGGYEYTEGGTETIATSIITGDKAFGALLKRKCPDYLYYDIDTGGNDVTVDILADGTSIQTLTLNTSSRTRKRSNKLKDTEGYRFALQITCADASDVYIYSPWALEATLVGE